MAFRLKPVRTGNNRVSYTNSLQRLKTQLNQLSNDRKIDFRPEQLAYVLKLLSQGISKMEQRQFSGNRLFPGNRRRNDIFAPIDNSNDIYTLRYPNTRQARLYFPQHYRGLKRKKKNIAKGDKKSKIRKTLSTKSHLKKMSKRKTSRTGKHVLKNIAKSDQKSKTPKEASGLKSNSLLKHKSKRKTVLTRKHMNKSSQKISTRNSRIL